VKFPFNIGTASSTGFSLSTYLETNTITPSNIILSTNQGFYLSFTTSLVSSNWWTLSIVPSVKISAGDYE
jgi:hypothetical protein